MATRSFNLTRDREAKAFTTAFYRFLELHGWTAVGHDDSCSLKAVPRQGGETKIVTFWNERTAEQFSQFWDDYRRVYCSDRTAQPARQARA